jgi:hypothetical protein
MAAKIMDGLFIGDADTSRDPEFLDLNKIKRRFHRDTIAICEVL